MKTRTHGKEGRGGWLLGPWIGATVAALVTCSPHGRRPAVGMGAGRARARHQDRSAAPGQGPRADPRGAGSLAVDLEGASRGRGAGHGGHWRQGLATGAQLTAIRRALCGKSVPKPDKPVGRGSCRCPEGLPDEDLDVTSAWIGSFTGRGRTEALVDFLGCYDGASSSLTYGGVALVRRMGGRWRLLAVRPGRAGKCGVFDWKGRSRLVCLREGGNMGLVRIELLSLEGRDGPRPFREDVLDAWFYESQPGLDEAGSGPVTEVSVRMTPWSPSGQGARPGTPALALRFAVSVTCPQAGGHCSRQEGGRSRFLLHYVWTGSRFVLAPADRSVAERLERALPHS